MTAVAAAALMGALLAIGVGVPATSAAPDGLPSWQRITVPSKALFKGLSPVSRRVVWLAGTDGSVWRTVDGGDSWADVSPAGSDGLGFYDIDAFSARRAVALASATADGGGRLYVTGNGGRTWQVVYNDATTTHYLDCVSFYDNQHGLALGDPIDGKFRILSTIDGGRSWAVLPNTGMPMSTREFAFATSGECLTTLGTDAWFGTAGHNGSRVFHSGDGGLTWDVSSTPVVQRPIGGIFGVAFRTPTVGIVVGGSPIHPTRSLNVSAITSGGGVWRTPAVGTHGIRVGIAFVPGMRRAAITVGLTGSDITYDDGEHWTTFSPRGFYTTSCASDGSCWASGDKGLVALLRP